MKVIVITKAKMFQEEQFVGVAESIKSAEKLMKTEFPYMRKTGDSYVSDAKNTWLLFAREVEVFK